MAARCHCAPMENTGTAHIAIRLAGEADTAPLIRLAALDSAEVPAGPVLVADVAGDLVAAQPLFGGHAIADPFRPTMDARELLAVRAQQLPPTTGSRRRHLPRFLLRRRGAGSPVAAAQ